MAKKSAVEKNKARKKMVDRFAGKRAALKAIARDRTLPPEERFQAYLKLAELPRNSTKGRLRNRCQVTGRPAAQAVDRPGAAPRSHDAGRPRCTGTAIGAGRSANAERSAR